MQDKSFSAVLKGASWGTKDHKKLMNLTAEDQHPIKAVKGLRRELDNLENVAKENQRNIAVDRARIDTFTALPDGATTNDAELQDIRVGYDGTVYDNAGEAVRGQAVALEVKVGKRLHTSTFEDVFGKARNNQLYDNNNPTVIDGYPTLDSFISQAGYKSVILEIEPDKTYCVSIQANIWSRFSVIATETDSDLANNATVSDILVQGEWSYRTVIAGPDTHYIIVYYYNAEADELDESEIRKWIKVEEGETPTEGLCYYDYSATENVDLSKAESLSYEDTRKIHLGDNLINEPSMDEGWSGNSTIGFTHASGKNGAMSFYSAGIEEGEVYICEFDTSYTEDEFVNVGIGDAYRIPVYNGTNHITIPLMAIGETKSLFFKPLSAVDFTISNISLRKIQNTGTEMVLDQFTAKTNNHLRNYGFWNVLLGKYAAEEAVGSTRTIAIGYAALKALQGGHRNIGIGTFAMSQMVGGENNVAMGADAMLAVKKANDNIVLGKAAAYLGSLLTDNVVIGHYAMTGGDASAAQRNTVIGKNAGWYTTGMDNTFVGYQAGYNVKNSNGNTCIGKNAYGESSGNHNTIVGEETGFADGASNSTALGYGAKTTKSNQVVLGNDKVDETLVKGDLVVRGTDGVKRQIVFNADGLCSWISVD